MSEKFLGIKNLYVEYDTKSSVLGKSEKIHAVNGVNLQINKGEIAAIAGESGCGKSTLAKAVMKLVDSSNGEILLNGQNITKIPSNEFYKKVQMIFQNPYSSLNPKMKIGQILSEPLEINTNLSKSKIQEIVNENLKKVGLDNSVTDLYPHEFSGGQRQRIAIARALMLNPEFIVADEPVSALDVSIQAQIINLLNDLKKDFNLTFLFISHDLSVIRYISDRIAVMYLGEIVEQGLTPEIFENPKHPYTQVLLSAVPELNSELNKKSVKLSGELPSPVDIPKGCKFHTRCPYVMEICRSEIPKTAEFTSTHHCNCFLYEKSVV
ncbi:MAG: ABC transporter ATP-binding protein [Candidatus Gastranaerophilaceae bacterium]